MRGERRNWILYPDPCPHWLSIHWSILQCQRGRLLPPGPLEEGVRPCDAACSANINSKSRPICVCPRPFHEGATLFCRVCASPHQLGARSPPAPAEGAALVGRGDAKNMMVSDMVEPDIGRVQPISQSGPEWEPSCRRAQQLWQHCLVHPESC